MFTPPTMDAAPFSICGVVVVVVVVADVLVAFVNR
jgi:hypothetical protein